MLLSSAVYANFAYTVSILARPEGRALLVFVADDNAIRVVSILARPEGRALPVNASARVVM